MKKFSTAVVLLLAALSSFSQEVPFGFASNQEDFEVSLSTLELQTFDHEQLLLEDTRKEEEGGRTNHGRLILQQMNADNVGAWTQLPNGDLVWQLRFRTAGAKGVSVHFDDLYLPEGSSLFLYPADRKYFIGPCGNDICTPEGHFVIGEVASDEAVLEYYQPASVVGNPHLGIRAIAHFYRYISAPDSERGNGDSEDCEVDVNCPEGAEWTKERDAVVRLTIVDGSSVGLCTGSLVNTTAKDCRRYILTAMHCGVDVSASDWLDCSVMFNYQRASCNSGTWVMTHNKVGVTFHANSNDNGGEDGSDFQLLELNGTIPASWNPYFGGWSASTSAPSSVVGIHHPAGDAKKISTSNNIVSGTYVVPGYHWRVKWMETDTNWGVTEGGSSGSPIYDQNHHMVGTLTGGGSFCDAPTANDFYGKFSRHWTDNPNSSDQKLKVWLDPGNTGITQMDGSYVIPGAALPCDPALSIAVEEFKFDDVNIYPSICDNSLTLTSDHFREISEIRVFNAAGALVNVMSMTTGQMQMEVSSFADGLYYISFMRKDGNFMTKKFTVSH